MRDIAADNLRNQTGVNLFRGALLFHSFHSQRLIWGQYSRERSGYNFQDENIWNDRFPDWGLCGALPLGEQPRATRCRKTPQLLSHMPQDHFVAQTYLKAFADP